MALTKEDLQAISDLMDVKLQPVNHRLDVMDKRLDGMDRRLDGMDKRLDGMDRRFDGVEYRLSNLESDVSALKAGQTEILKKIEVMDKTLSDTYQLALDAWGISVENRTWLEKSKLKA